MTEKDKPTRSERKYPPFFEKAIPIILVVIVILIIVLLVIIMGVSLGFVS
ncbi:MAG: hypothetical protein MUO76_17330 [Anaerolineaceae bacterium]|nr:hypothetical protein [Anaerolineaceae bacterium]